MDVEAEGSTAAQVMPFEVLNNETEPYVRVVEVRSVKIIAIKVSAKISFHLSYSENNANHIQYTRTKLTFFPREQIRRKKSISIYLNGTLTYSAYRIHK